MCGLRVCVGVCTLVEATARTALPCGSLSRAGEGCDSLCVGGVGGVGVGVGVGECVCVRPRALGGERIVVTFLLPSCVVMNNMGSVGSL